MDNPGEIRKLSQQRLDEAIILSANGMIDGAFYILGYSVELALKAKICEVYGVPELFKSLEQAKRGDPKSSEQQQTEFKALDPIKLVVKTHNLFTLLILSGLGAKFRTATSKDPKLSTLTSLLFNIWNENARYKPCGHFKEQDVKTLVSLLPNLLKWIETN